MRLHIKRYIIADQVELEDVIGRDGGDRAGRSGRGGDFGGAGRTGSGDAITRTCAWDDATVAAVTVTGQPGVRIFCSGGKVGRHGAPAGGGGCSVAATAEDARLVRIENGRPRYGEDIRDTSLPQETQQMHARQFQ